MGEIACDQDLIRVCPREGVEHAEEWLSPSGRWQRRATARRTVELPLDLLDRFERLCQRRGEPQAQIVERLLRSFVILDLAEGGRA